MRNVERRQVEQFERPEPKTGLVLEDAIDRREVRHAFARDAQRLRAVAAPRVIDDEAGRVLGLHGAVAHLRGIAGERACRLPHPS